MDFVTFITQKAAACGWRINDVRGDKLVVLSFSEDSGTEHVYIRPCGKNSDGNTVIEFTSIGFPIPDDEALAQKFAFALLSRNGEMLMGHWGIEKIGENQCFTIFVTQIANTMDVDEFKAAVTAILNERRQVQKILQSTSINF